MDKKNNKKCKPQLSPDISNDQIGENASGIEIQNEKYKKNHTGMKKSSR